MAEPAAERTGGKTKGERRRKKRRGDGEKGGKKKKGAPGRVSLVGAGPGDPGLLTLAALDRLKQAHVVIYDRLVSKGVLAMIPPEVVVIYGGKEPGSSGKSRQDALNKIMLDEAKLGRRVVRLKGGDPFLFSRGGEEGEFLRDHGIEFEVVPGVSSALAVPAYAGIPLTDRRYSSSVTIVTGQEADIKEEKLDWSKIAGGSDVLVVLMGASRLKEIATRLISAGESRDTPLAAIMWGTTDRQAVVTMTLGEAAADGKDGGKKAKVAAPCVIVIGEVVSLASKLDWLGARTQRPVARRARRQPST
jgi:uroporphyrin-III C-methyltransferase